MEVSGTKGKKIFVVELLGQNALVYTHDTTGSNKSKMQPSHVSITIAKWQAVSMFRREKT